MCIKLYGVVALIILLCIMYYFLYIKNSQLSAEEFDTNDNLVCGYKLNTKPAIDLSKGNLQKLFINLNGSTYKWDNSPINSIRLNSFDFVTHTVDVTINDTPPVCKTIDATDSTFIIKNVYLNQDFTYFFIGEDLYVQINNIDHKLITL
jgi:hypothetical protein